MKKIVPLVLLILLNLYPIAGILFWKWDVVSTLSTYFVETIILVIFAIIKMILSRHLWDKEDAKLNQQWVKRGRTYTIFNLIAMMCVFTVILCAVYFIPWEGGSPFLGDTSGPINYPALFRFMLFSIVVHGISFVIYFIIGNERETLAASLIFRRVMIGRILPLFLTPFVAAFMFIFFIPNVLTTILIVLFLVALFDVMAHIQEHKNIK